MQIKGKKLIITSASFILVYLLSILEINSDNFVNSSSVPLNIPGGIFPLSVPFLAISAISSGDNPVPTKVGAAAPPSS